MADQEQTEEITQEEQVFLDRVGIVLRGAKHIAAYDGGVACNHREMAEAL